MRLFGLEIKKQRPINHDLTPDDRELGKEARRMTFEQRRMDHQIAMLEKRAELMALQQEINDQFGEEEDTDSILAQLLSKIVPGGSGLQPSNLNAQEQTGAAKRRYTDEELRAFKKKVPMVILKQLRGMSDDEIITKAQEYFPDNFKQIDDDTLKRAVLIVREK